MGWKDLLEATGEKMTAPWTGGRELRDGARSWAITGPLPVEHGWYVFKKAGRKVSVVKATDAKPEALKDIVRGYLVGDRFVPDDVRVDPDALKLAAASERLYFIEEGLSRFARLSAGRNYEDGPLLFIGQEMPLGPEEDVLNAYYDKALNLDHIRGVAPALDAAFRLESWRRAETERQRAEVERLLREEEERRAREERRKELVAKLGDAQGRREMALQDFGAAARAALAVGGAEYLDHRKAHRPHESVVTFRVMQRRFECTCDDRTLRIIDAGICLTDHGTGERGDTYFTLESLPAVILDADRKGKLVVFRHAGDNEYRDDDEDYDYD